ncbi:DNA-3-methyladenine glycosylase 2 [Sphaerotilus sp.]|uniref:DNA-3-methyladenine glycosylase 2 n=1 Tax=Sphaerotilus sp. TaxID=2093942 RepID=UPI0034E28352
MLTTDPTPLYAALVARDRRFDGHFLVGVTSTGIYCRPVCSVRTPKADHCRYFPHAAAAEAGGFRPCLRCRPELAPGLSSIDAPSRLAWAAARRIEAGALDEAGLAGLAAQLGITDRHLRRVFGAAFGVSPVDYAQTQRLLLAKRLLADTTLPVTDVALAAGFGSLRRFNTLFRTRYGLTPSTMRRASDQPAADPDSSGLRFELAFRPPFDWAGLLDFLAVRGVRGVEEVIPADTACAGLYRRTLRLGSGATAQTGWLAVTLAPASRHAVELTVSPGLQRVLPAVLAGVTRLCDLSCDPLAVAHSLGPLAVGAPGLRVPGAIDGFEVAVRAVLGQQIRVKAAHTLAGRLVEAFGEASPTPFPALHHRFPTPGRLAELDPAALAALGIVRSRAAALVALARAVASGALDLGPCTDLDATLARLQALPGIGPWTAQYIALRALGWPDAWPSGDVVLRKALGGVTSAQADALAQAWRPWRSYATLHLWRGASATAVAAKTA